MIVLPLKLDRSSNLASTCAIVNEQGKKLQQQYTSSLLPALMWLYVDKDAFILGWRANSCTSVINALADGLCLQCAE